MTDMLAIQKGIANGGNYLGYEVNMHAGHPGFESIVTQTQKALGELAFTSEPDEQLIRRQADVQFARQAAGAPADFAFRRETGESIIGLLAEADRSTLVTFCHWHKEHFGRLQAAILETVPEMHERICDIGRRLAAYGLLPRNQLSAFGDTFKDLATTRKIKTIDSFDSALILGSRDARGIYLAHQFTDGIAMRRPSDRHWHTGTHETIHETIVRQSTNFGKHELVKEVLIDHCVLSGRSDGALANDLFGLFTSTKVSNYAEPAQLLAIALDQSALRPRPSQMTPLLTDRSQSGLYLVVRSLEDGFDTIFPEYRKAGAYQTLMEAYERARHVSRQRLVTDWLKMALERTGPPDPMT